MSKVGSDELLRSSTSLFQFPVNHGLFKQLYYFVNDIYHFQLCLSNRFLEDNVWYLFLFYPQPLPKNKLTYLSCWTHPGNLEYMCVTSSLRWAHYLEAFLVCSPGNQGCWCPWIKRATQGHCSYRTFMSRTVMKILACQYFEPLSHFWSGW